MAIHENDYAFELVGLAYQSLQANDRSDKPCIWDSGISKTVYGQFSSFIEYRDYRPGEKPHTY